MIDQTQKVSFKDFIVTNKKLGIVFGTLIFGVIAVVKAGKELDNTVVEVPISANGSQAASKSKTAAK